MIIHTIIPDDILYAGIDQIHAPEELVIGGILMQIERLSGSQVKVIRILSPNPEHYMTDKFAPGQTIHFEPRY